MWLRTTCNLEFQMVDSTPLILMLRPRSGIHQWVAREAYTLSPSVPVVEYTDIFGNLCQRLVAPAGYFSVHTSADVMTANNVDQAPGASFVEIQNLPDPVLLYLLPSRYCESDRFGDLARSIVDGVQLGYDQVYRISDWVRNNIRYMPGSSAFPLSAVEVNAQNQGVCRDLAHLGIALCRSISIPARLVVGFLYGLEPMDLHAWFEAYVGGRWYTFDPTDATLRGGRLAVAYGRDAAEVSVYHQFGPPAVFSSMDVHVEQLDSPPA
ncbi:MAG TPA: transglutaminase family protein [Gammaproteobacteria bacterium]|nr:transglutaminase family protein [Gammaproteobacteria bacterium]